MRRVIAQHPAAAVSEDEDREPPPDAGGAHDVQFDGVAVGVDGLLRLLDARKIDRDGGLRAGQHLARFRRGQGLERRAARRIQDFQKCLHAA